MRISPASLKEARREWMVMLYGIGGAILLAVCTFHLWRAVEVWSGVPAGAFLFCSGFMTIAAVLALDAWRAKRQGRSGHKGIEASA